MSEVENSKGFLHHLILNKGAGFLTAAPIIIGYGNAEFASNGGFFDFFIVSIVCSVILNLCDAEYLKYHGFAKELNFWEKAVTPLYLSNREKLLGRDHNVGKFALDIAVGFLVFGAMLWFTQSGSVENQSCKMVTEIIDRDYGSETECDYVELEEIMEDAYVGYAYLDNDESVRIAVYKLNNNLTVEIVE